MRPNAVPAKLAGRMSVSEEAEFKASVFTKTGKPRWAVKDLCDYCLHVVYLKRDALPLRKRGKKFMCEHCRFEDGKQDIAVKNKDLPCWRSLVKLGRYMDAERKKKSTNNDL